MQLSLFDRCPGYITPGEMAARTDEHELRAYVEGGGYATLREHEVYAVCVRDGVSVPRAAVMLGLSWETVRVYLRRLRLRVRQPHVKRQRRVRMPMLSAA